MNNSSSDIEDPDDHKDFESNDSITNPNLTKSRPTTNAPQDDMQRMDKYRHPEECSCHPWYRYRIDETVTFLKRKGWEHPIKRDIEIK